MLRKHARAGTGAALVATTLIALNSCGGGGTSGGTGPSSAAPDAVIGTYSAGNTVFSSIRKGRFSHDGAQYIVVSAWTSNGSTTAPDAPVKVYKLNADGTAVDATAAILGPDQTASANYPLIADFNGDGIDDIFFAGFKDFPVGDWPSVVFLSRAGQSHRRVDLPDMTWSHGSTAADIDGNGSIDVINNNGQMWLNDGQGNFTFRDHSFSLNTSNGLWMHGSGVCVADFNNTGRKQVLITDLSVDSQAGPIADTVIFELDSSLVPTNTRTLPVPVYDRATATEVSHDFTCAVGDVNGDGLLDVMIFSRPLASARNGVWTDEGLVQMLMNRGNWNFEDTTETAFAGYNRNVDATYIPVLEDLNGDGTVDLWSGYFDWTTGKANQAWVNNGSGVFTQVLKSEIDGLDSNGVAVPVKFGSSWAFVYSRRSPDGKTVTIYYTQPRFTFSQ